jgi:hypothetical protein
MSASGRGGKGRANEFFNAAKSSDERGGEEAAPAPEQSPAEPPPPPEPAAEEAPSRRSPLMKPSPFAKLKAPEASGGGDGEAKRRAVLKASPFAGLSREPAAASPEEVAPPPNQVRVEVDPRSASGEQTKPIELMRRKPENLGDLLDATFGETVASPRPPPKRAPETIADEKGSEPIEPGGAPPETAQPRVEPDAEPEVSVEPEAHAEAEPSAAPLPEAPSKPAGRPSLFAAASVEKRPAPKPEPAQEARPPAKAEPEPRPPAKAEPKPEPRAARSEARPEPAKPSPQKSLDVPKRTGDLDEKHEKLRVRLAETPDDPDLLARFASLCADMGRNEEAIVHYRRAAQLAPGNGFVRQRLRELGGEAAIRDLGPGTAPGHFRDAVRGFLAYPLRGPSIAVWLAGGVLFGALDVVLLSMSLFAIAPLVLAIAYVLAYQLKVIDASAQDRAEPPAWPRLAEVAGDAARVAGGYVASYGLPAVLALVALLSWNAAANPAGPPSGGGGGIAGLLGADADAHRRAVEAFAKDLEKKGADPVQAKKAAEEEFADASSGRPEAASSIAAMPASSLVFVALACVAAIAGTIYFPMALLITTIFGSSRPAFSYLFGVEAIRRIWGDYVVCAAIFVAAGALLVGLRVGLALALGPIIALPFLGPLISSVVAWSAGLYAMLALSHLVGRLYFFDRKRMEWL